jgi:hypothetical protein
MQMMHLQMLMDAAVAGQSLTESRDRGHARTVPVPLAVRVPTGRVLDTVLDRGLTGPNAVLRRSLQNASRRRRRNRIARALNRGSAGVTAANRLLRRREPADSHASHQDETDVMSAGGRRVGHRRSRQEIAIYGDLDETNYQEVTATVQNRRQSLLNAAIPRVDHLRLKKIKVDTATQAVTELDPVEIESVNRIARENTSPSVVDRTIPTPEETEVITSRRLLPSIVVTRSSRMRKNNESRQRVSTRTIEGVTTREAERKIKADRMRRKSKDRSSIPMEISRIERNARWLGSRLQMPTCREWIWMLTVMTE